MGLDNGVLVRRKDRKPIEIAGEMGWEKCGEFTYEIVYFRKYWGLRDRIVDYLNEVNGTNSETYEWHLNDIDIKEIIDIIKTAIVDVICEDFRASTIWEQELEIANMGIAIRNLFLFLNVMEHEDLDDYEVLFYDSY